MPLLVHETRGGTIDNSHHGHIAIVGVDGALLYHFGNARHATYGRSALKPMQVLPVIETGAADHFEFNEADIALCAASHSGEERHRSRVSAILKRIGLGERDLHCGPTPPVSKTSYEELLLSGRRPDATCNCCSGVHAGMLATAVFLGEDLQNYTKMEHPVQQRVMEAVMDVTACPEESIHIGNDGCGIPTYQMPLYHIAWGYARLTSPHTFRPERQKAIRRVIGAFIERPDMVTEQNIFSAKLMRAFQGRIVAKEGAKGVFCFAEREKGIGIAFKVDDGSPDAIPAVTMEILQQLNIGTNDMIGELDSYCSEAIKNSKGERIGNMKPVFELTRA